MPLASAERYYVATPALSPVAETYLAGPSGAAPAVHAIPPSSDVEPMQTWMPTFAVMFALAGALALRENSLTVHRAPQPAAAKRSQRAGAVAMGPRKPSKNVQVVLKTAVENVGKTGDVVSVKHAFFENVLWMKGQAAKATPEILEEIKAKAAAEEAAAAAAKDEAKQKDNKIFKAFGEAGCVIEKEVGPDGAIFGSVTTTELAEMIKSKAGVDVDKKSITVSDIKKEEEMTLPVSKPGQVAQTVVGTASADIKLHPSVLSKLKIMVVAKGK